MQTPIKKYEKIIETDVVVNLTRYKTRRNQARYYWNMKKCSYVELARHSNVSLPVARRWELAFIKEFTQRNKK